MAISLGRLTQHFQTNAMWLEVMLGTGWDPSGPVDPGAEVTDGGSVSSRRTRVASRSSPRDTRSSAGTVMTRKAPYMLYI